MWVDYALRRRTKKMGIALLVVALILAAVAAWILLNPTPERSAVVSGSSGLAGKADVETTGPLKWDNHLGHTYGSAEGTIITHTIQIGAINGPQEMKLEEAYIISETGSKIDMKVSFGKNNWVSPKDATFVPPNGDIVFYAEINPPSGLTARDFFDEWKVMYLTIKYDGGKAVRTTIDEKMVAALFSNFRPNPLRLPPTRKSEASSERADIAQGIVAASEIPRTKPRYQPEEIGRMLTAFLKLREILDQMPSASEIDAVRGPWERIIKSDGPAIVAEKVKAIAEKGLVGINALDHYIEDNKHFKEELYSTILPNREPALGGFLSTSHQLFSDLAELSKAQNIDVIKWTKAHFEDWTNFSNKYLQWISSSNALITAKTKELREWKNP